MSKSIKFKNNTYLDSSSIVHNKTALSEILGNIITGSSGTKYTPAQMAAMTSGNTSAVIDISKTHLFYTDWDNYASYDNRFPDTLGIYIKSPGSTSTCGVAIIFFYAGAIGVNVRIDNTRWGGWKWLL